jgi:transcriptional regulator with XRE-family HTH domain
VSKYPARQRALAAAIKNARTKAKMTRYEFSIKLGKHHTFIGRIERLQRDVTATELLDIEESLDLEAGTLYQTMTRK